MIMSQAVKVVLPELSCFFATFQFLLFLSQFIFAHFTIFQFPFLSGRPDTRDDSYGLIPVCDRC